VLLVGIAVMSILMSVAMPVWKQAVQREKEQELVFRGEQYARAIGLFQRKFAGAFPPSIDVLVEQRFLRKKYKDPMTADGEFQVLYATAAGQQPGVAPGGSTLRPGMPAQPELQPGTVGSGQQSVFGGASNLAGPRGGMIGVASKSKEKSIRLYRGRGRYNEWQFVYSPVTMGPGIPGGGQRPGLPGTTRPGQMGPGTGAPGQPMRPGGSGFPSPGTRPGTSPFSPGGTQPPRPQ
jgi:type II secretory pathway pseudopilin PulG